MCAFVRFGVEFREIFAVFVFVGNIVMLICLCFVCSHSWVFCIHIAGNAVFCDFASLFLFLMSIGFAFPFGLNIISLSG